MAILVIRIVPEEPTSGSEFTAYLENLTITAFDISFGNTEGVLIGSASYVPPEDPSEPLVPNEDTQIVQHFIPIPTFPDPNDPVPTVVRIPLAVATAIIETDGGPEHETPDIRLEINRSGVEIAHRQLYYNVPVAGGSLPDVDQFRSQDITSLYLSLPAPAGVGGSLVELPEDGRPPNFADLRAAVVAVLENDPGAGDFDLAGLTPQQSKHLAREIIFNRNPLPAPPLSIERLYTSPDEEEDRARQQFEAELQAFYAVHNANVERLTGYIYALSAAEANAARSAAASQAGLNVPLQISNPGQGTIKATRIILTAGENPLDPSFAVPADHFYALGAIFPLQTSFEQRYELATMAAEKQLLIQLEEAINEGVIDGEPGGLTRFQVARRLVALGATRGPEPQCTVEAGSPVQGLLGDWLEFEGEDMAVFWETAVEEDGSGPRAEGHLDLILCAITEEHTPLIEAIKGTEFGNITTVNQLTAITAQQWRGLFLPANTGLLPPFTLPGTPEERVAAFIGHLAQFFAVGFELESPDAPDLAAPPLLHRSPHDPIQRFVDAYNALGVGNFDFGSDFSPDHFESAIESTFPNDPAARAWLDQALRTIHALWGLVQFDEEALRFSLVEALFARGFRGPEQIREYTAADFQEALIGTVAFQQALAIHGRAVEAADTDDEDDDTTGEDDDTDDDGGFQPVNTDCCLVNCIPPPHLSSLGPIAYLREMLRVSEGSTCEEPFPPVSLAIDEIEGGTPSIEGGTPSIEGGTPSDHLRLRCGSPAGLLVTRANLETPLPRIDLVNECLEATVASLPDLPAGHVHNTNGHELGGHALCLLGPQPDAVDDNEFCHDPAALFEALPEHSTPATPVDEPEDEPGAYDILARDFSNCHLPYSQPLDISRAYLSQLGTSRFQTMRTFRAETSEFVLDPENPPGGFESHRWREPVSEIIAAEYLGISPDVLALLFRQDIATSVPLPPGSNQLILWVMYGFPAEQVDGESWLDIIVQLQEFLKRTCLTYCEFLELQASEFVRFHRAAGNADDQVFPECESCDLEDMVIEFDEPADRVDALRRLIVFIRLWRILQGVPGARYSFLQLRDICVELGLFSDNGTINPDFIRQVSAFQRTRDLLQLPLFDPDNPPPPNFSGVNRTQLLALTDRGAFLFDWALDQVFDHLQPYAQSMYHCPRQPPHYLKLLEQNIDAVSRLAGFDPDNASDTWHAEWTHILRMIEVLAKVYASQFTPVDLLFLFTADAHRAGHDPLPQQPDNEAAWRPFDFVDDLPQMSLFALREKLLAVEVSEEEAAAYHWTRIDAILRDELGYEVQGGETDFLDLFGNVFVPSLKEASGMTVAPAARRVRAPLADTVPTMAPKWNTPAVGPFRYDPDAGELWVELPLTDQAVSEKLSSMRQLTASERMAVRSVYFAPREIMCALGFLFPNKTEADERLIQEPNEQERIRYFQMAFARFHTRCNVIAEHLAGHVAHVTSRYNDEGAALAWRLLTHVRADDNFVLPPGWDTVTGGIPAARWRPSPLGGAFHALLGLVGTGLLCEYRRENGLLAWRDTQGPLDLFGASQNAYNVPKPTVIPSLALDSSALTANQDKFLGIRNGYAMDPSTGKVLGGIETYTLELSGFLLVDEAGDYTFQIHVDPDADGFLSWYVRISQGDFVYNLLVKGWPSEEGPARCSAPARLRRGVWKVELEIKRKALHPDGPEDVCPQRFGTRFTYRGKDTGGEDVDLSRERLYLDRRPEFVNDTGDADNFLVGAQLSVVNCYEPPIWVMRRTYIRTFKALLCAWNHRLSVQPVTDSGGSELDVFLNHPAAFEAESHFRDGATFGTYHVDCDFNALPVFDNHHNNLPDLLLPHILDDDERANPSLRHRQAIFRLFFEDFFDYTVVREETMSALKTPFVRFLHEVNEEHQDVPLHALVHAGFHEDHVPKVLRYFQGVELTRDELFGFSWLTRLWQAEKWLRSLKAHFLVKDIRELRPDLIASTEPAVVDGVESESGNANLTAFYRNGSIENGEPRRYLEIKRLNDGLRERGRRALLAYLTGMNRVALPWGGFAERAVDLSELLLMDVEAGVCQKASRIEEAISSVQLFVQRARLGLEPNFEISNDFALLWDRRFATYAVWLQCKRREIYPENWIHWKELHEARRTEGYLFLESELRRSALTIPVPGGLEHWPNRRPPKHPSLTTLQAREPATIASLELPTPPGPPPTPEGLDLMGTPERDARLSWLAALRRQAQPVDSIAPLPVPVNGSHRLPFWIRAAIRLGTRFIRVAAAGEPPASTSFAPHHPDRETECCVECGKPHPALVDEYYFWLVDSRYFSEVEQNANWRFGESDSEPELIDPDSESAWHNPAHLPGLLRWNSEPMVHLFWSRIHNGEFKQTRRSFEGVRVQPNGDGSPQLHFLGRSGDSLRFRVTGGVVPVGFSSPPPEDFSSQPPPGFRYDLATDSAVVLPEVPDFGGEAPDLPSTPPFPSGLPVYPYFIYHAPGAPLIPPTLFSPAITISETLRAHCRFEAALKWLQLLINPLQEDLSELWCIEEPEPEPEPDPQPLPVPLVRNRFVVLRYVETLLAWGDAVMRGHSPESFQKARLIFDTAAKILGEHPRTVQAVETDTEPQQVLPPEPDEEVEPDEAPLNPDLLALYDLVDDRLDMIRACLNGYRLRNGRANKDMPYWGNSLIKNQWDHLLKTCHDPNHPTDLCLAEIDWCCPPSPYRFVVLVRQALDLANEVRGLGAALLAAYEKGDAEYLASLRATHERQLLSLALEIRQNQWRESDWQVQALRKTREMALTRKRYFEQLIENGLIANEEQYRTLTGTALGFNTAGTISEGIAQVMNVIPDIWVGSSFQTKLPIGEKLNLFFAAAARFTNIMAMISNTTASLRLNEAGWERREDEWHHQVEVLDIELQQIERQILAAERRRAISLRELNNHQRQLEHVEEVHDFLRDKFTNHELYLWLQQETAALHYQMYELALHCARQAERAYNYERGHTSKVFITGDGWDNLHEGLLAGDRLHLTLRQMEKSYLDCNVREYELTRHFSLRRDFPWAFLLLRTTGYCEFQIPEWMFDRAHPGHYMRRIKNVSLTIPAVVGPYTSVNCRLTLLSSSTRVSPVLVNPPAGCCPTKGPDNPYEAVPDDPRFVKEYAATEAIATSSGNNDTGMFELNFRDERYLPFEYRGAISCWRLELPKQNNDFDLDTLSDVILHLNFMAREGGDNLRAAADHVAQRTLPGGGLQYLDIKRELPNEWHRFIAGLNTSDRAELNIQLTRKMFPYLFGNKKLFIQKLAIFIEAPGAMPSAHRIVELWVDKEGKPIRDESRRCDVYSIHCVATDKLPGLFHGVLPIELGPIPEGGKLDLGAFKFGADVEEVSELLIIFDYVAR